MKKRLALILTSLVTAAAFVLAGATFAFGGGPSGLIFDDGQFVQPGSLDDGQDLQSQASIGPRQAIADAQRAASGSLGQVDLEHYEGKLVYSVDVVNREVESTQPMVPSLRSRPSRNRFDSRGVDTAPPAPCS